MGRTEQTDTTLTPRQKRAIAALMTHNVTDAAKAVGVARRTLTGWLALPHFKAALHEAQTELEATALRRLSSLMDTALNTLSEIIEKGDKEGARVSAINTLRDWHRDLRMSDDFEQRIAALEAAQRGKDEHRTQAE